MPEENNFEHVFSEHTVEVHKKRKISWSYLSLAMIFLFLGSYMIYVNYRSFFPHVSTTTQTQTKEKLTDKSTLMSRFMLAINKPQSLEEGQENYLSFKNVYENMQDFQGEKISFEEFQKYFQSLHQWIDAELVSFSAMDTEAAQLYKEQILKQYPDFSPYQEDLHFYWLKINPQVETEKWTSQYPFILFMKEEAFYFPAAWIRDTLEIFSLYQTYWDAIQNENVPLLKKYLKTNVQEERLLDTKVNKILAYYKENFLQATQEQLSLTGQNISFLGNVLQVMQEVPKAYVATWQTVEVSGKHYRFLNLELDESNALKVKDIIPEALSNHQFSVYQNKNLVLSLGQFVNVRNIIDTFGWWGDRIAVSTLDGKKDAQGRSLQKIQLAYDGIYFEVIGSFDSNTNYIYGAVSYIEIQSSKYNLKMQDFLGDSKESLLSRYVFLDEQNFLIKDLEERSIKFEFNQEDMLEKIILTKET